MVISRETKIDYTFGHKTKLNTFKIVEIVHSILCDNMEPTRINNIKTIEKSPNIWKSNNTRVNNL